MSIFAHQIPLVHLFVADNFEMASLPSTSEEERKRLLSFVVCGGGPTGVETAAVRPHPLPTLALFAHLITGDQ